jgi:hypothetical protein
MTDTLQETNVESTDVISTETRELTPQEQLNELIAERTGSFVIQTDYTDLKWVKNSLEKAEFKGANEAYLVVTSAIALDQALSMLDAKSIDTVEVSLDATVIETINFFLNRHTGKGVESARRLFIAAMKFRKSMETISELDKQIEKLSSGINSDKK